MATRQAGQSDISRRREERRTAGGRRSDARWDQIVDAAARVFRRLGYSQATLEDVANEVGVRRATLYYYVGTKEELLISLLRRPLLAMTEGLEKIVAIDRPASERLTLALRDYVDSMGTHPELFIFLSENLHKVMSGEEADEILRNADRYGHVLRELLASGIASGEFRADLDPGLGVLGILGMFNWMHRWYDPEGERTLQELGAALSDLALHSVRA